MRIQLSWWLLSWIQQALSCSSTSTRARPIGRAWVKAPAAAHLSLMTQPLTECKARVQLRRSVFGRALAESELASHHSHSCFHLTLSRCAPMPSTRRPLVALHSPAVALQMVLMSVRWALLLLTPPLSRSSPSPRCQRQANFQHAMTCSSVEQPRREGVFSRSPMHGRSFRRAQWRLGLIY